MGRGIQSPFGHGRGDRMIVAKIGHEFNMVSNNMHGREWPVRGAGEGSSRRFPLNNVLIAAQGAGTGLEIREPIPKYMCILGIT